MLISPNITWDGDVATIEIWVEGKKARSYAVVYDCRKKERIGTINPKNVYSSAGHIAEGFVQRAYDRGNKVDHINCYCWF